MPYPAPGREPLARMKNLLLKIFAGGTLILAMNSSAQWTGAIGNAPTASALATPRTINGVSFDGTANITVPAAGSTLTDTATVAKGGTGDTTLGTNGVLIGEGTSAVAVTGAGTAGQVLTSNGAGVDPTFQTAGPIVLSVKNVTVLTTGTPADIATITVPSWITRWKTLGSTSAVTGPGGGTMVAETAAGTLAAASFTCFSAAGGSGNIILAATTGPTAAGGTTNFAVGTATSQTSTTLYIRQTANSANAGTLSFYMVILPLN